MQLFFVLANYASQHQALDPITTGKRIKIIYTIRGVQVTVRANPNLSRLNKVQPAMMQESIKRMVMQPPITSTKVEKCNAPMAAFVVWLMFHMAFAARIATTTYIPFVSASAINAAFLMSPPVFQVMLQVINIETANKVNIWFRIQSCKLLYI